MRERFLSSAFDHSGALKTITPFDGCPLQSDPRRSPTK